MRTGENEFTVNASGSIMAKNETISNQGYYNTTALLPTSVIPSFAAPQPSHNLAQHHYPLAQQYAIPYFNALSPQANISAGLSPTAFGIKGTNTCSNEGAVTRERNENTRNFEPAGNSGHQPLPDKHADKVEDDLQEIPPKKRKSNWIHARAKAYNNGTDQEPSNPGNHSTAHDSSNSNARLLSTVVTSIDVPDVAGPSAQTGGGEMDEEEKDKERKKIKHRESARKSRLRTKKICKELKEYTDELRREISFLTQTIDFYSKESLKTRRQNKALQEELATICTPEEFAAILAENPDLDPPSSDDEGGY